MDDFSRYYHTFTLVYPTHCVCPKYPRWVSEIQQQMSESSKNIVLAREQLKLLRKKYVVHACVDIHPHMNKANEITQPGILSVS